MTEEALRKGSLPEAPVLLEGKLKKRADITFKETVRIRRVIVGILPSVQITSLNQDAKSTKSAYFKHTEVDSQPCKKPKQSGGKGSVASQPGCVFQEKEPP